MAILLRITLTPIAFTLVSKAQSRFGDWIGGRLIGLPLTTGPFLLTVCMTSSRATAAHAAAGVTSGQMAVVVFCSSYAWTACRLRPLPATIASLALALTSVVTLSSVAGIWSSASAVWIVIAASLVLWPWARESKAAADDDIAPTTSATMLQRALISTCVVATMSTLVPILGARPAGIISSAPILLSIMLPGTHRQSGAAGAAAMARHDRLDGCDGGVLSDARDDAAAAAGLERAAGLRRRARGARCGDAAARPCRRAAQSAAVPRPCSSAPLTPASSALAR